MKKNSTRRVIGILVCLSLLIIVLLQNTSQETFDKSSPLKTSGAGTALDMWSFERSYPGNEIFPEKYLSAFQEKTAFEAQRSNRLGDEWESLGPQNIGGRTLCLAFHPTDEDIIFAGSASGGLWKSTTQGLGVNAWEYVPTGFPVLGVAAIAIDQNNPDIMVIGTGETYGVGTAEPGTVNRLTRGTYGIGILKTIDGGNTWSQSLSFNESELKGIQDIEISNQNSQIMFATATDGLYRSTNGGDNWSLVFNQLNCIDVEIDPSNGNNVYVSQGNFNYPLDPSQNGIFKSTDGGNTFNELLDPGLITAWSGSAKLTLDPSDPNTIYADIQVGWFNNGATTPAGIYKSTNGGINWANINNQNIAGWQGWYSHDLAVNPNDPNDILNVGIAAHRSIDGGANFVVKSQNSWTMGEVPIGIPEGNDVYVHSDIHAVYYHPINNKVFYATDGGVFVSENGEQPFTTLNGGLQTTQFYADMGSSTTDPGLCIAGAQDNATYIYRGNPSWWRVIGGDGMTASVRQTNDDILYGSSQGLNMWKSTDNGNFFSNISPTILTGDYSAFSAPFELAPTNNELIYAGTTFIYKSEDGGNNWAPTSNQTVDGGNTVIKIAISPINPDVFYIATVPDPFGAYGDTPKVLKTIDGGQTFTVMSGLPNRICKDIEFDPNNEDILYTTFSGFGSSHVFKSIDAGANWTSIDSGLPDLPTNTIAIDPLNSDDIYVGNDLGVYYSDNGGSSWVPFNENLPEAVMIYDLNVVPVPIRKLRIATHGHGIYQRNFVNDPLVVDEFSAEVSEFIIYPNPTVDRLNIEINAIRALDNATIVIYNVLGQKVASIFEGEVKEGQSSFTWNRGSHQAGSYFVNLSSNGFSTSKTLILK